LRQFHLFIVNGQKGSELDSSKNFIQKFRQLTWRKNFSRKLLLYFYIGYLKKQENLIPGLYRLKQQIIKRFPDNTVPIVLREELRNLSLPLCKWENFMTFNWRSIFLFMSILIGAPWLFFVVELTVFNIVLLYVVVKGRKICAEMNIIILDSGNN
jgi:hypothetical protein